jgi:hypothetical protein
VTLNTFYNFQCAACAASGIRVDSWTDNNTFAGYTYVGLTGSGGVGVHINPVSPTTFTAVYALHFTQLAIDTFGTGLGRYGVVLNNCQAMQCEAFFQDPPAENGSFNGANCTSYWWKSFQSGGSIFIHEKAVSTGL